ncbi:MAG: methionyl-tRNA formyltransferase [Bacteroidales bacterium]|jgi:methionyl-tRNA formyltransferase|nr:methionyl-tRNA formyltransferase [Bacteroidales bacterium]
MTKKKEKPELVFMGTPGFAAGILQELLRLGYSIKGVVTAPDKPAGRGLVPQPSAVKTKALENKIPVLQPVSLKESLFLDSLSQWDASIFVVVAFRMLPEQVWKMPSHGCLNLHASLLPEYRGAAPINHAIINGERETGLTTFLIDKQIDTGAILLQQPIPIAQTDNAGTLQDKMMAAGAPLVARTIDGLWQGTIKPVPQPFVAPGELKQAPRLSRETCRIDWSRESGAIVNLIRGLSPYPCAFSTLKKGETLMDIKVYEARAEIARHGDIPGKVVSDWKTTLKVACRGGYVHLLEVQAPGKKRLSAGAFLAGFRNTGELNFR